MNYKYNLLLTISILWILVSNAQQNKKALQWQDIPSWSYIRTGGAQSSDDGKWFAYVSGPTEGDLILTLKQSSGNVEYTYKIGGQSSPISFSNNSQYIGFYESLSSKEIKANQKAKRPSSKKLKIISLNDTVSTTFDKVQSFSFSNDDNRWLAIRFESAPSIPTPAPRTEGGSDLLLYNLTNKKSINIGNVSDFKFNKSGQYLAYTISATNQNGNGIYLLDLKTGLTNILQNDEANFSKVSWNKEGTAFALVKSKKDKKYKSDVYALIGIKNIKGQHADIFTYNGLDEDQITAGFGIGQQSIPYWSKDLNSIFFGIAKLEKVEEKGKTESKKDSIANDSTKNTIALRDSVKRDTAIANVPKPALRPKAPTVNKKDLDKPDMIIWNWQDKRLQSAQRTQLQRDKNFIAMSVWHVQTNKFVSLADSTIKSIALAPNQLIGYSLDFTPYEYESNLDGQSYADLYITDIKSGERRLAIKKHYLNASRSMAFSPNGSHLLYYANGDYYLLNTNNLSVVNITKNIPSSFIDNMDDHNVSKPATPAYGWTEDGKYILIKDNYDLWKIAIDGKSYISLTDKWKNSKISIGSVRSLYPDDEHIDLKKDQYFNVTDENTKKNGIAFLAAGQNKIQILKLDDIAINQFGKARNANALFYTIESSNNPPEYFVSKDRSLQSAVKLTTAPLDSTKTELSSGSKLISYISDHGDTLQAVLYLPADYVEGKSYPTITYIYERLTQGKNNYAMPSFPGGGFNRAMYTNNGYAVLMPDIKYKLNDPGMSAVACVIPAVKAAIATGIVDQKNVAIHGHSWGGYQTSFLITQTDIFKAAVAGAPLTNMISMYSLIYWNSGGSNQSIFESSQGRLTSGYWDNWDAYARNSPIYHIKKVNTPLIIMHNDKDGAVDYTQGIEYFNGLRRLNKPVVMLTYNGENHGLEKEVNRKDYAVRMMEYFDHFLKGKDAPDWWTKGVDLIDLPKHLEERAF